MNLPIIRLEVEGIRRTMSAMLAEHAVQMDADLREAVDAYCTPENLARVVKDAATRALDATIKEVRLLPPQSKSRFSRKRPSHHWTTNDGT
jgi:hypothetical protein